MIGSLESPTKLRTPGVKAIYDLDKVDCNSATGLIVATTVIPCSYFLEAKTTLFILYRIFVFELADYTNWLPKTVPVIPRASAIICSRIMRHLEPAQDRSLQE